MAKIVRANTNIALIKYWGKADEALKIPTNSSLSMTLDNLYTETSVDYQSELSEDVFYLDGIQQTGKSLERVQKFMDYVRKEYNVKEYALITSYNHVPSAAGLASSASAFAALAKASTLHLNLDDEALSRLARVGSGSASRSVYEGLVEWEKGKDHETSFAKPIPNSDWPELRMVICFVNEEKKKFSSGFAMQETSQKSAYFDAWVKQSHEDIVTAKKAIEEKNLNKLGTVVQENALRMHASLMAVNKWYFEPKTIEIMNIVETLQAEIPVYFTMDAGPNVKILTDEAHVDQLLNHLKEYKTMVCKTGKGLTVYDEL
ncbi:diphosphomevalonate decarboxylase [Erysipelothrix urinaevulpis]|uniref:diphosphomevalonate decarboxylase n=1 Tax=Erysipelothrix urinaevulpis TaxID=2683717 RepID=UPI00135C2163|nr:diphosphomevalonate decarboxylase [Erysipelothrix urinaevulpis]